MAAIYTAADVLLGTAYGEGFGVPNIEAQACGTPVIVTDWTAMPELVGAGWIVPSQPLWDAPHSAYFGMPLIPNILGALEDAYQHKGDELRSRRAVEFAQQFDADRVFAEHWQPVLAEMERLLPGEEPIQLNRAQRRARR